MITDHDFVDGQIKQISLEYFTFFHWQSFKCVQ